VVAQHGDLRVDARVRQQQFFGEKLKPQQQQFLEQVVLRRGNGSAAQRRPNAPCSTANAETGEDVRQRRRQSESTFQVHQDIDAERATDAALCMEGRVLQWVTSCLSGTANGKPFTMWEELGEATGRSSLTKDTKGDGSARTAREAVAWRTYRNMAVEARERQWAAAPRRTCRNNPCTEIPDATSRVWRAVCTDSQGQESRWWTSQDGH